MHRRHAGVRLARFSQRAKKCTGQAASLDQIPVVHGAAYFPVNYLRLGTIGNRKRTGCCIPARRLTGPGLHNDDRDDERGKHRDRGGDSWIQMQGLSRFQIKTIRVSCRLWSADGLSTPGMNQAGRLTCRRPESAKNNTTYTYTYVSRLLPSPSSSLCLLSEAEFLCRAAS